MARLRTDKIRRLVRDHFTACLAEYKERLNDTGLSARHLQAYKDEIEVLDPETGCPDMSDDYLDGPTLTRFKAFAGLSDGDWAENERPLLDEVKKGRLGMLKELLKAVERRESYNFAAPAPQAKVRPDAPQEPSSTLSEAIRDFLAEQRRHWEPKTADQNAAYLEFLVEYFGPGKRLCTISNHDAGEVKKLLLKLPARRKVKPKLKDLSLLEVVETHGHETISPKTINSYLQMFQAFFAWAANHGHTDRPLFENMKVAKAKHSSSARKPFTQVQTQQLFRELTSPASKIVRKESHKWGTLLAMFTGARLNEICQLGIADIQQEEGIWFLHITDEGDEEKRVKSNAARRKVPIHNTLLELGFLDFVSSRRKGTRLFPDFPYSEKNGYGRNLGRWCNETLLVRMGYKAGGVVFHCFRHTVVTRLGQADVPEPVIQCLVGHARAGVTQEVYLKEGYRLTQLRDALNLLSADGTGPSA